MIRALIAPRRASPETIATLMAIAGALALSWFGPRAHAAGEAAATPAERAQLETDLKDARERLDDAARDVAELTRKLYGDEEHDVMQFIGQPARGAMLGVNVDSGGKGGEGVRIVGVSPGGPAAAAGLKTGDVIVAVDGKSLTGAGSDASRELVRLMRSTDPGTIVSVDYLRAGKRETAKVKTAKAEPAMVRMLRERDALPMVQGVGPLFEQFAVPPFDVFFDAGPAFRSLELVSVTPKLGQYFGTDKGLLVVRAPSSPQYGLEEGDVLLSIEGRAPENPGHAFRILRSYEPGEQIKLQVLRNRKRMDVAAQIPEDDAVSGAPGRPFTMPLPPRVPAPPLPVPPPKNDTVWIDGRAAGREPVWLC
jgi:membrane-associated protease RseP (regulator of RpoE activity)